MKHAGACRIVCTVVASRSGCSYQRLARPLLHIRIASGPDPQASLGGAVLVDPGLVGGKGYEPSDLFRVKEGPRSPLTCVLAAQPIFGLSQEFGLVPRGSVGSLTWC